MISGIFDKLFSTDNDIDKSAPKSVKHRHEDIGDLLEMYHQQNHLLTAIIMDATRRKIAKLTTGIRSIDHDKKEYCADEFLPKESNKLLTPEIKVQFSLTHQGVRHQFESTWLSSHEIESELVHQFAFPKGIEQIQLRDAFRVKLSQAHPIKVTLTHAVNPPASGNLADLSASGMRVRMDGLITPKPLRGETYTSCHLVLSDGSPIVCAAKLVHWQYDPDIKVSYLGIQFEQLDGNTQRALNRYLTDIQRKQRHLS